MINNHSIQCHLDEEGFPLESGSSRGFSPSCRLREFFFCQHCYLQKCYLLLRLRKATRHNFSDLLSDGKQNDTALKLLNLSVLGSSQAAREGFVFSTVEKVLPQN